MKNELIFKISKRFSIIATLSIIGCISTNYFLFQARLKEINSATSLEILKTHRSIMAELHTILYSVESDFEFIKISLINYMSNQNKLESQIKIKNLMNFLQTHQGYFKVRLISKDGFEIFKIKQNKTKAFEEFFDYHDLSKQAYYQDLLSIDGDNFYFSSMEPNIINGIIEEPIKPTIRVSKNINFQNKDLLLVINIDGHQIHKFLINSTNENHTTIENILVDSKGYLIAENPGFNEKNLLIPKKNFYYNNPEVSKLIKKQDKAQGSINYQNDYYIYSRLQLPSSKEQWTLISKSAPNFSQNLIKSELFSWIFWELLFLSLFLTWLYRDEKNHFEENITKILLKERTEFIQNVSHQLKTPLAVMLNHLQSPDKKINLVEFKSDILFLVKIIDDMLMLSQIEASTKLSLETHNVVEIIESTIEKSAVNAKEQNILIKFDIDQRLAQSNETFELPCMSELLVSALLNIIDNAIDFSPPESTVKIYLNKMDNHFEITISDEGPGIDPSYIADLFTRFNRFNYKRKGSGLGLPIAKKIIELHFGKIELVPSNHGASFRITI